MGFTGDGKRPRNLVINSIAFCGELEINSENGSYNFVHTRGEQLLPRGKK